jgi:hypothetical protein
MVELTSYGLTGLVAIMLVAFCFACKDEFASFSNGPSPANSDPAQQDRKNEGALHG